MEVFLISNSEVNLKILNIFLLGMFSLLDLCALTALLCPFSMKGPVSASAQLEVMKLQKKHAWIVEKVNNGMVLIVLLLVQKVNI